MAIVGKVFGVFLNNHNGVVLRGGMFPITLFLLQRFEITRTKETPTAFQGITVQYNYTIEDTQTGHEILAFHLHPGSVYKRPHLHLGSGAGRLRDGLDKAHLPTGPISIHEVIQLLIRDFKVSPARPDADAILAAGRT